MSPRFRYYTGVQDSRPSETHLFRRPDSASRRPSGVVCLTCDSPALSGRRCDNIRVFFPPSLPLPAAGNVRTEPSDVISVPSDVTVLECTEGAVRRLLVTDRALRDSLAVLDGSEEIVARIRGVAAPHLIRETVVIGGEVVKMEVMLPKLWDEKKGGSYLFPFVLDM